MDIKESLVYKAVEPLVTKKEIVVSKSETINRVYPTEPRENDKIIRTIKELDDSDLRSGRIRKLYQGADWSSEEAEQEGWRTVIHLVNNAGVDRFNSKRWRPYSRTPDMNLCLKRRKFKKIDQEEIKKQFECNYQIGEKREISEDEAIDMKIIKNKNK
jgi:hypothetical protein